MGHTSRNEAKGGAIFQKKYFKKIIDNKDAKIIRLCLPGLNIAQQTKMTEVTEVKQED